MSDTSSPSPNGSNGDSARDGRDHGGRFTKGNCGGPGNPHARRVAKLRSALLKAVTPADMREIVNKLVAQSKEGNVQAAKEVLERTLGRPLADDLMERIERLEAAVQESDR